MSISSEYDVHWSHIDPTCTPPTPDTITPLTHSIASLDLLIIGGGYTGLSTARYMKETFPHLRIGIVEKEYCGYGASGRNSGYVNAACIYNHPAELVHTLGPQRASHVASTLRDAVSAIKSTVKQYNIDCDLEESGLAYVAIDPHQSQIATSIHDAAHVIGSQSEHWDHPKCHEQLGSPLIQAATIDPEACQINPYKYCRGILNHIIRPLGINVWEGTEMISCIYGTINRVTVRSTYGEYIIHTRYIVHATNAYTKDQYLKTSFCPIHVYSIVTEPVTQEQRSAMGWISHTGIYTLHNILTAIRWTSDHRLLVSTGNIAYHSKLHTTNTPHQYQYLQEMLHFMYPTTKDIQITSKWEGVIAINLDDRPIIGVHPKHENVYHALAYCGHGVPLSNYAGTLIRDLFLHQQSCHALHVQPSSQPTSPIIPSPATSLQLPFNAPIRIPIPSASCIRKGIDVTYVNYLRWQDRRANKRAAKANGTSPPLVPYSRPSTLWFLGFTSLLVLEIAVLVKLDMIAWKAIQARYRK